MNNKNLTIRQQLLLAVVDRQFVVSPELEAISREINKAVDNDAAESYMYSVFFIPGLNIAGRVDEALEAKRDICLCCEGDTTNARIGFNCCHCGGN